MKAIWNNKVIAESNDVIEVEGCYYFPLNHINRKYFVDSKTKSTCPWKGKATYMHITIDGEVNEDAAWCYTDKYKHAYILKDRIAFWKGVTFISSRSVFNTMFRSVLNSFF